MSTVVHFEIPSDNLERTRNSILSYLDRRWRRCQVRVKGSNRRFILQVMTTKVVGIIVIVLMAAVVVVVNSGWSGWNNGKTAVARTNYDIRRS